MQLVMDKPGTRGARSTAMWASLRRQSRVKSKSGQCVAYAVIQMAGTVLDNTTADGASCTPTSTTVIIYVSALATCQAFLPLLSTCRGVSQDIINSQDPNPRMRKDCYINFSWEKKKKKRKVNMQQKTRPIQRFAQAVSKCTAEVGIKTSGPAYIMTPVFQCH